MAKLDAKKVNEIFMDCLFKEHPACGTTFIPVKGITMNVGLQASKVEEHSGEIKELLDELPDNFKENSGGGWSFLEACVDKEGNQWGEHNNMQELLMLGIASGWAGYLVSSRELWSAFPGGVPYFMIFDNKHEVETRTVEEGM